MGQGKAQPPTKLNHRIPSGFCVQGREERLSLAVVKGPAFSMLVPVRSSCPLIINLSSALYVASFATQVVAYISNWFMTACSFGKYHNEICQSWVSCAPCMYQSLFLLLDPNSLKIVLFPVGSWIHLELILSARWGSFRVQSPWSQRSVLNDLPSLTDLQGHGQHKSDSHICLDLGLSLLQVPLSRLTPIPNCFNYCPFHGSLAICLGISLLTLFQSCLVMWKIPSEYSLDTRFPNKSPWTEVPSRQSSQP